MDFGCFFKKEKNNNLPISVICGAVSGNAERFITLESLSRLLIKSVNFLMFMSASKSQLDS